MFLDHDDMLSSYSQVSLLECIVTQQERVLATLRQLGEHTALAEKFLGRLKSQLAAQRSRLEAVTHSTVNETTRPDHWTTSNKRRRELSVDTPLLDQPENWAVAAMA